MSNRNGFVRADESRTKRKLVVRFRPGDFEGARPGSTGLLSLLCSGLAGLGKGETAAVLGEQFGVSLAWPQCGMLSACSTSRKQQPNP
jgi:hypothetical protein